MRKNDTTTLLLQTLADIGSQDIYTDAHQYSGRVDAMRALIKLAQDAGAGRIINSEQIQLARRREAPDIQWK